jgi:hypothetical protein
MRRAVSVCVLALVAAGCGEDDGEPPPPASDEQQIAAAVNGVFDAVVDDDGEAACSLLTERGQRYFHVLARREFPTEIGEGADCEAAVAVTAEQLADKGLDDLADYTYVAEDVHIQEGRDQAQVRCEFRGAVFAKQVDGDWLVDIPACID